MRARRHPPLPSDLATKFPRISEGSQNFEVLFWNVGTRLSSPPKFPLLSWSFRELPRFPSIILHDSCEHLTCASHKAVKPGNPLFVTLCPIRSRLSWIESISNSISFHSIQFWGKNSFVDLFEDKVWDTPSFIKRTQSELMVDAFISRKLINYDWEWVEITLLSEFVFYKRPNLVVPSLTCKTPSIPARPFSKNLDSTMLHEPNFCSNKSTKKCMKARP